MGLKNDLTLKVKERLGKEESEITENARFIEDLGADSLDLMDFIMEIETDYNIKIPANEVEKIKTFGDLVNYLSEKTGQEK